MTKSLPPIDTLRDGPLKASIWENEGTSGAYYAVTFSRTFRTSDGHLADSTGFVGADLLRIALLAQRAYVRTNELRQANRPAPEEASTIEDDRADEPDASEAATRRFNRQSRQGARRGASPR